MSLSRQAYYFGYTGVGFGRKIQQISCQDLNYDEMTLGSSSLFLHGMLYLVATPIGNLSDISARALETLKTADLIYCEDTRTSAHLLHHYGIKVPLVAFHQHNEHKRINELVQHVQAGRTIALISDAGTPGISDPGFLAARAVHQAGLPVCAIPGASALTTALSASGLPCDRFIFEGFLPPKKGRSTRLDTLVEETRTVVLYESPYRIVRLLEEIQQKMGDQRFVAVARELTKKFEEIQRGPIAEILETFRKRERIKGEFVIIIAGAHYSE